MRKYLLATTGIFAACAAHAQCQAPTPAAAAGYTTQTFGGPIVPGQNWTGSAGDGVTQNQDGSVTIANPSNNHYNAQLSSAISVSGGAYIQGTLQALGPVTKNGGWPSIWLYDHEARPTDRAEVDIAEVYGGHYGSAIHDWNGPPGMSMSAATNTNLPQISVDLTQSTTFGVLLGQGLAQFYLNGQPAGPPTTWSPGGPFSITDQSHLTLALGTGQTPVKFSNVQVWQASSANDIGVSPSALAGSGCAPVSANLFGGAAPAVPTDPTPTQAAAPTVAEIVPGQGSIADSSGNTWTISSSGCIQKGGQDVPGGCQSAAVEVVNGIVWGQDNGKGPTPCPDCWFTLSADGQNWTPMPGQSPYGVPVSPSQPTPSSQPQPPVVCGTKTPGSFRVNGGRIVGPNGPFIARGINLRSTELSDLGAVLAAYPGLNFLRLNIRNLDDPSSLQSAVDQLTARGTVVELEVHPNGGGGQGSIGELSGDVTWYAQAAAYFRNNAYVWFGTYNEPPTSGGSLSAWHKATYQAIRGAGNNAPILIEPGGSRPWNLMGALDPGAYAGMMNIIWDPHVYGYQVDYSTDQATNDANVKAMVAAAQTIRSADGSVPAIIGEYGDSTDGSNTDPNGTQNVEAVINSGFGSAAWSWISGGSDMLQSGGTLTEYGQRVALLINTSVIPCSQGELNAQAQQAIKTAQATVLAQQQPAQQPQPTPQESTPPPDPSVATANAQAAALIAQADVLIQQAQTVTAPTDAATQALIDQANANLQAAHQ